MERNTTSFDIRDQHECYHYIYMIRNKKNDKKYIGQTKNPEQRFYQHIGMLKNNRRTHSSKLLQEDFDNGNEEDFEMLIIEKDICPFEALAVEFLYMVIYRTYDPRFGYNEKDSRFYSNMTRDYTSLYKLIVKYANK